ncbi:MAG TPA: phosphatidate cytidylyltransferase [Calidithermus sp.]|nr:phosphatidate cytidylyltransferase [Calidithermus sp.]
MAAALEPTTAVTVGRSGRTGGILLRLVTAAALIPLIVWLVTGAHPWLFTALVCAVVGLALWELLRLFEQAGQPTYRRLGVALGVVLAASFEAGARRGDLTPALLALVLALGAVLAAPVALGRPAAAAPAVTLLALLWVGWLFGHALLLHRAPHGEELVLVLVGVTWVGETAAYVVGSALGRQRLAPTISPAKTVEGAVAQFLASVATAVGLAAWMLPDWPAGWAAGAGALLGLTGQLGDLAESAVKRSAGVKDAGGLLPGHGGVLDRVDGLLFNVPALYYYVRLGGWA